MEKEEIRRRREFLYPLGTAVLGETSQMIATAELS